MEINLFGNPLLCLSFNSAHIIYHTWAFRMHRPNEWNEMLEWFQTNSDFWLWKNYSTTNLLWHHDLTPIRNSFGSSKIIGCIVNLKLEPADPNTLCNNWNQSDRFSHTQFVPPFFQSRHILWGKRPENTKVFLASFKNGWGCQICWIFHQRCILKRMKCDQISSFSTIYSLIVYLCTLSLPFEREQLNLKLIHFQFAMLTQTLNDSIQSFDSNRTSICGMSGIEWQVRLNLAHARQYWPLEV